MPDLATPAAPAAPAAPSAPAPVSSSPAAPAPVAAPVAPATPAPEAPAAAPVRAPYDSKTATAPPKSTDYPNTREGQEDFVEANTAWDIQHPDEANALRTAERAADAAPEADEDAPAPVTEAPAAEDAPKPADAPAAAATPAQIDEWTSKSPKLKEAFDENPELRSQVMELARGFEAAKPVLDIVGSVEEAQFAVENANRMVSTQAAWMLAGEDPDMVAPAWDQTVDFFKERDANGNEVKGPDGKAKLASDFKPFVRTAATHAMGDFNATAQANIAAIEARLKGNYPNDAAREADNNLLEQAQYEKAAFDFVLAKLGAPEDSGISLPALPADATPQQIEYQKNLEARERELAAKNGTAKTGERKAQRVAQNRDVQSHYESGMMKYIDTNIAAMQERGEYLPDFVINDKWINPQTQKVTNLSAFGVKIYNQLNAKINDNPTHRSKLANLEALGNIEARKAEVDRLTAQYLPGLFKAEVSRIQDGIRSSTTRKKPAAAAQPGAVQPRVEPSTQSTVVPAAMDGNQTRNWAEVEARKDPSFAGATPAQREQMILEKELTKQYGG